jgi:hypothetical protein
VNAFEVVNNFDVRELLPRVQVPTLVMMFASLFIPEAT